MILFGGGGGGGRVLSRIFLDGGKFFFESRIPETMKSFSTLGTQKVTVVERWLLLRGWSINIEKLGITLAVVDR
jgi:hypothetical protein